MDNIRSRCVCIGDSDPVSAADGYITFHGPYLAICCAFAETCTAFLGQRHGSALTRNHQENHPFQALPCQLSRLSTALGPA